MGTTNHRRCSQDLVYSPTSCLESVLLSFRLLPSCRCFAKKNCPFTAEKQLFSKNLGSALVQAVTLCHQPSSKRHSQALTSFFASLFSPFPLVFSVFYLICYCLFFKFARQVTRLYLHQFINLLLFYTKQSTSPHLTSPHPPPTHLPPPTSPHHTPH